MQSLAASWANGIAAIAILIAALSFAVTARSLGRGRISRGIAGILVFVIVIGSIFVGFFAPQGRSGRRVRSTTVVHSGYPGDPIRDGEDIVRPAHPPTLPRSRSVDIPEPPTPETTHTWETFSERFANGVETAVERITALAERKTARAEALRIRMERFRGENREPTIDDDDEAAMEEDTDCDIPPPPARRAPLTLVTVLASTALLYVGYLFLDANTRGQFTWSLRVASLFAFAGIIAAVVSLT